MVARCHRTNKRPFTHFLLGAETGIEHVCQRSDIEPRYMIGNKQFGLKIYLASDVYTQIDDTTQFAIPPSDCHERVVAAQGKLACLFMCRTRQQIRDIYSPQ